MLRPKGRWKGWSAGRRSALRHGARAACPLAARGGSVNPASKGASQALWRLPPLHRPRNVARVTGKARTHQRRENAEIRPSFRMRLLAQARNDGGERKAGGKQEFPGPGVGKHRTLKRTGSGLMSSHQFALFDTAIGRCGIVWGERGISAVQLPMPSEQKTRARIGQRHAGIAEASPPAHVQRVIARIVELLE